MAVSASDVKKLREMTGAGMMDCKKALTETDGNFDEAVEFLRKKGLASADKKAGRIAAEGIVKTLVSDDNKTGVVIEVNSETDFVAKNEKFQTYVEGLAKQLLANDYADVEAFKAAKSDLDPSMTVEEYHKSMVATIGENLTIRRFEKISADVVYSYIYGGGKTGVLVAATTDASADKIADALKNIAMQIVAFSAKYISSADVPEDYKAHELSILVEQAKADPKNAGKPDAILEKMTTGRLNKELKGICLLEQELFNAAVFEGSVGNYLKKVSNDLGVSLEIKNFVRFETGEGLEKKNEDFAAEVAAQMGQ